MVDLIGKRQRPARAVPSRLLTAVLAVSVCCGGPETPTQPSTPDSPGDPVVQPPPVVSDHVFAGAGDIGWCGSPGPEGTARLLDALPGTVFTTGDNAYMQGTPQQFAECYDPSWGRHKSRTYPSPGNHDYGTPGAAGYYTYFGSRAGPPGLGYYGYDLGNWHVVSLNSEVPLGVGSAQLAWLRADLTYHPRTCTLAYWHRPLYSSGPNGGSPQVRELWRLLFEFHVDVVLNGHDHLYERFAPQDADGRVDASHGIRQFTIGTGGGPLYQLRSRQPHSEAFIANSFGILKLVLRSEDYTWEFQPVGASPMDVGFDRCR